MAPFDAARLGVYLHGLAGDIAAARVTERGGRADDRRSEAAMEDRKREGLILVRSVLENASIAILSRAPRRSSTSPLTSR